jgi:hypothetical protein
MSESLERHPFVDPKTVDHTDRLLTSGLQKAMEAGAILVDRPEVILPELKSRLFHGKGPLGLTRHAEEGLVFRDRTVRDATGSAHFSFPNDSVLVMWILHWWTPGQGTDWMSKNLSNLPMASDGSRLHPSPCGTVCPGCFILEGDSNDSAALPRQTMSMPSAAHVRRLHERFTKAGVRLQPYGMEPLARLDLLRETEIFRGLHQISTTGHLIANDPDTYLPPIYDNEVGHLQMSFHQPGPKKGRFFGGGSYDTVRRAVELIRDWNERSNHRVGVALNTVVNMSNYDRVMEHIDAAYELGVDGIRFTREIPERESFISRALPAERPEPYRVFYEQILRAREKYKLERHATRREGASWESVEGEARLDPETDHAFTDSRGGGLAVYVNATFGYYQRPWLTPKTMSSTMCPGGVNLLVLDGSPEVGYQVSDCLESRRNDNIIGLLVDDSLVVSPRARMYADLDVQEAFGVGRDETIYQGCHGFAGRVQEPFRRFTRWMREVELEPGMLAQRELRQFLLRRKKLEQS